MSAVRADHGARFLRLGAGIHTLMDAVFFGKEPRCGTGVLSHSFQAHTSLSTVQLFSTPGQLARLWMHPE